jgi:DNA-binding transcriptional regulator YiaG
VTGEGSNSMDIYRYTECGLDYVYLRNGFQIEKSSRGNVAYVSNATALDRAIAQILVDRQPRLKGQEVRFLRGLMDMSLAELARVLRLGVDTVARWENDRFEVSLTADIAVRHMYLDAIGLPRVFASISRKVTRATKRVKRLEMRLERHQGWTAAAAKLR